MRTSYICLLLMYLPIITMLPLVYLLQYNSDKNYIGNSFSDVVVLNHQRLK